MLKEELCKIFKSKKSLLLFGYLMIVALADNICGIAQTGEFGGYPNVHPTFMSLLSGQSALVFYALFFWIFPITITLLYCGEYIQENKKHMNYVYISKVGRKKYFMSKLGCSFIVTALYFGIPLLVNLIVSILFLNGGTSFLGFEELKASDFLANGHGSEFLYYCFHHPYVAWLIYFIITILVLGFAAVMSQCIAMISKDIKITLSVSFAIWISLFSIKYDLTMAIQPFTEYGLDFGVKALLVYIPIVVTSVILSYVFTVVKKDEI